MFSPLPKIGVIEQFFYEVGCVPIFAQSVGRWRYLRFSTCSCIALAHAVYLAAVPTIVGDRRNKGERKRPSLPVWARNNGRLQPLTPRSTERNATPTFG